MSANVTSIGLKGLEGYRVQVEFVKLRELENHLVGMPSHEIKAGENREWNYQ